MKDGVHAWKMAFVATTHSYFFLLRLCRRFSDVFQSSIVFTCRLSIVNRRQLTHDKGKALRKWIPMLVGMSAVIILVNPFLNSRGTTIFFYFRGKQVTLEATVYGVVMALSLVIILLMFISFNLILNGNKFLFVFSKFLPKTDFFNNVSHSFCSAIKKKVR